MEAEGVGRAIEPEAAEPLAVNAEGKAKPARRPLPDHPPREVVRHPAGDVRPACGGRLRDPGEGVSEVLDGVPGRFRVPRHVRPERSCRCRERIAQAPAPGLPIPRGRASPALLAHVLAAKHGQRLPLHRQTEAFARRGVDLARSTLADRVGQAPALLAPPTAAIERRALAAAKLHGDDTPVPVLEPGRGRTKAGRLWVHARDGRPCGGDEPPAAFCRYSPDRRGVHAQAHLATFAGVLQADGYAGFNGLYRGGAGETPRALEAGCRAHARRTFCDLTQAGPAPIAEEARRRAGGLYAVEAGLRGRPPDQRRRERQAKAKPIVQALRAWLEDQLRRLPGRSATAGAIRYGLSRWPALSRYLDDGCLGIDDNAAERAPRGVALGRKDYLLAGFDAGGERAAALHTPIASAKLNGVEPCAHLHDALSRIAEHPVNRTDGLLPRRWAGARGA